MTQVLINNAQIETVDTGKGPGTPVVFIHGFPFDHTMWQSQLDAVSAIRRTIAYDLRGLGGSSVGDGQYTIEGHVDDLIGLLDHLRIEKTVVAGLSMGGYIALRALERNPERFTAAVLCDTRSEADSNEVRIGRAAAIAAVKKNGSNAFADDFVKKIFAASSQQRVPRAIDMIRSTIARTPPLAIAGLLLALAARTDTTDSLSRIAIPTLIMVGEHDVTTPPDASRSMHVRIKGSQLQIIPLAAHMSPLENPEAFNKHLLEFLAHV